MPTQKDQQFIQRLYTELFAAPVFQELSSGGMTPELYRSAMAGLDPWKNESPVPDPEIAAYHPEVELRAGLSTAIGVPRGEGPFPILVTVHGNGLSAGSAHLYRRWTKDVAANGYLAITPDFRLAPEHPFPAGYDDMRFTLDWAREHAAEWGGDASRLVVFGDSVGASLALGLVLGLQDEDDPPPIAAFVGSEGRYDLGAPYMAADPAARALVEWYLGDGGAELLADKRVSPLPNIGQGLELPSVLLITGSADIPPNGTLDLAQKLSAEGIDFQLHVLDGMPHDFMKFPELDGMWEGHRLMYEHLARLI